MDNNEFYDWINAELAKRGWGVTELSRRMGITHSAVSHVLSKRNKPSTDFCHGLADAFGIPPAEVFSKAGLLPPVPPETATVREMLHWFSQLSDEDQERALAIIKSLYETQLHAKPRPSY